MSEGDPLPNLHHHEDWRRGDLALCVRGGKIPGPGRYGAETPVRGRIYSVSGAMPWQFREPYGILPSLELFDGPLNADGDRIWPAFRFRKIKPLTPGEHDEAMFELLTGRPVKEPV